MEDAISPQLRAEGMDCIEKRDIDGCKVVAEKLVEEILPREGFLWICWICVPMTIIPMHIP